MANKLSFSAFAERTARYTGSAVAFTTACGVVLVWAITGPLFDFSDTWQLVINTGTTIITFLMVFLVQATQNRDAQAIQLKLDELLRATQGAHTALMSIEVREENELKSIREKYLFLAQEAQQNIIRGVDDGGTPEVSFI